MSGRRRVFTVAAAVLMAGTPVVVAWPSAGAAPPRPPVFSSSSYTTAVHVVANPVPTPFVAELGRGDLPQGSSAWDASSAATATASTYYPGVAVTGGVALVCSAGFPCPPGFPPPFPTVAAAQYPTTQDASVPTSQHLGDPSGPVEAQALRAVAHAGTDRAESTASNGGLRLAGSSSGTAAALSFRRQVASILHGTAAAAQVRPSSADSDAVRVDALTAHTRQSFDDSGALVSVAESTLHGVHLLGDTVFIQSIVTSSVARVDPSSKLATNESHTVLGAVSAGGQPARIDERGITIGSGSPSSAGPAQSLNDALRQALAAVSDRGLLGRVKSLYLVMTLTCLALALGTHASWWARLRGARAASRP